MSKVTVKWAEAASRANLLANVPLRGLDGKALADIILLRVAYDRKADELREFMADVARKLKPQGYDDRASQVARMEEVERRSKAPEGDLPTPEELAEAEETRKNVLQEHERERQELEARFQEAQRKKMDEDTAVEGGALPRDTFNALCQQIGTEGALPLALPGQENPVEVGKAQALAWLAQMVEEG